METNRQKLGLASLVLLLVTGLGGLAVGLPAHSLAAPVGMAFAGLGFLVAAMSAFQMRLEERERLEKLEYDELAKSASPGSSLFTQEAEAIPARRTREQFEKYVVPCFTVLLLAAEAAGALFFWRWVGQPARLPLQGHTVVMAVCGLFALLLFMSGKYVSGIVRLEHNRLLRPSAGFLLLNAYLCVTIAATTAAEWAEFSKVDLWVARLLCGMLSLISLETLLGLVFEMYRPRVKGREARLLYDSRLVGLLSQPESLVSTMAHALDYQFGFKVSETWFYRSLEKALAWVVLAQLGILVLSTTFVMIEPGEQALLERLGRPVAGRQVLDPGLHFKLPWPVDKVQRYRTERLQSFVIGMVPDQNREEETLLWSVSHAKEEYNLLVANRERPTATNLDSGKKVPPVNLLAVNIPVQYQVTNLLAWAYNHAGATQLLEQLATREVIRYLVNADINELMTRGRGQAAETLRQRIQDSANERQLGAYIVFVGLAGIHPPVGVAEAYENVVATMQEAEATNLASRAYALRTNVLAGAAAYRKLQEAQAEKLKRERSALARAAAFTNQIPAFTASPSVYGTRALLQSLTDSAADARKYVLAVTNTQDVLQFNFEDKLQMNMLDVPPREGK
ncbi:MAG: SPFH domain-containing protein [Verrucomicrobia bacterium]|nr:SPFH domain-containing protein [Verrucomicrobiota bacterium]